MFQFVQQVKQAKFNYDLFTNARETHILPNIRDAEFLTLSPQGTAALVKQSNHLIDVLDGETLDLAFALKS